MIPVIRYNATLPKKFATYPKYRYPQARERYAKIAAALKLPSATPEAGVESLVKAVAALNAELSIPATIREAGIPEAEFESAVQHMAEVAFDDQCMGANPSYTPVEDLVRILRESYRGNAAS
jgi:acetaldehyde dehydrogenase / alcohol dehydrogenase